MFQNELTLFFVFRVQRILLPKKPPNGEIKKIQKQANKLNTRKQTKLNELDGVTPRCGYEISTQLQIMGKVAHVDWLDGICTSDK